MDRKTAFASGEHYHIFTRGVEKRKIFLDKSDYDRFQTLLYIMNKKDGFVYRDFLKNHSLFEIYNLDRSNTLVSILSYTLMPNHFHLLLYEHAEGGITKFMSKVLTAYAMYFNTKYKRSGPLFVRPFRSSHISNESYYLYIFSYIHLNIISLVQSDWEGKGIKDKSKAEDFIKNYKYSTFCEFEDKNYRRPESKIIDFTQIPEYIQGPFDINDLLTLQKQNTEGSPL